MSPLIAGHVVIAGLARAERAARIRHARREREARESGPCCEVCGAPIYRPGLCAVCAECYQGELYQCPLCGRVNQFVNQCGCDPDNLPTVPVAFTGETAFNVQVGGDR